MERPPSLHPPYLVADVGRHDGSGEAHAGGHWSLVTTRSCLPWVERDQEPVLRGISLLAQAHESIYLHSCAIAQLAETIGPQSRATSGVRPLCITRRTRTVPRIDRDRAPTPTQAAPLYLPGYIWLSTRCVSSSGAGVRVRRRQRHGRDRRCRPGAESSPSAVSFSTIHGCKGKCCLTTITVGAWRAGGVGTARSCEYCMYVCMYVCRGGTSNFIKHHQPPARRQKSSLSYAKSSLHEMFGP